MNSVTATDYDDDGVAVATMIDPTGNIAHFEYDAVNRATRTEDPAGGIRTFAYDSQDKPVLVTDANGNPTAFTHDALGHEIERRNARGDTWTFAYDSRDNMTETTDAKGQRIEKVYDELNRMIVMTLIAADGFTVEDVQNFAYDAMGQKTLSYDGDSSLGWAYDGANRVATASVHGGPGFAQPVTVLTNAYNAVGDRTNLSDGHGGDTWFDYDGEGRLARVTTPAAEIIDLAYDPAGRLKRIVFPNTVETNVAWNAVTGRPDGIAHTLGATNLASFGYGFDTDGKITSIADAGGTRNFTYDETLQVTGGGYAGAPENYAYDPEGNRMSSHLSASYTHDTANRL